MSSNAEPTSRAAEPGPVVSWIRRLAGEAAPAEDSDGQLLDRFVRGGDEGAFEAIVRRHGPMVLGVCRQTVGNPADADDAFQATFLVLVRKAADIGRRELLASWLYGVARRVAVRARSDRSARLPEAARSEASPGPFDVAVVNEEKAALHQEVGRLPAKYRRAVVLCYLEGKTNVEAARLLGWPEGTVKVRLQRARQLLRDRLGRRGMGRSDEGITAALGGLALPIGDGLAGQTVHAAVLGNAGECLESPAGLLARGVLHDMVRTKVQIAAGFVVALVVLAGGVWGLLPGAGSGKINEAAFAAGSAAKADRKAERQAIAQAYEFLKQSQKDGNWEHLFSSRRGSLTSLATLALLESGTKRSDPVVSSALEFLRKLEPDSTYALGLQTMVFCRAEPKKDLRLIRRNAMKLLETRGWFGNVFVGWTYQGIPEKGQADNSNTHFAILALHAAAKAGVPIPEKLWLDVQDSFLQFQSSAGGWGYSLVQGGSTITMTCVGVSALLMAKEHLKDKFRGAEAVKKGMDWLGDKFRLTAPYFRYYQMHDLALTGRLAGVTHFTSKDGSKKHDWYREGVDLLLRLQAADGSWREATGEAGPVVGTSFALLFLGKGP